MWVGFPGSAKTSMNGMYAPTGGNIDGGTYPADIWGAYMKQAVGKYCGDFKKPTEPFTSQPFLGHYAREGGKDDEKDKDGDKKVDPNRPGVAPGTQTAPGDDTQGAATTDDKPEAGRDNDANFDPNAYETPPQADPGRRRRKLPATAEPSPSGLVQLAPSGPPGGHGGMREGSPAHSRMLDPRGVQSDGYRCREVVQRREGLRLHHA